MTDRPFTILSTGALVAGENHIPGKRQAPASIRIEEIPFIQIDLNQDDNTRNQVLALASQPLVAVFTSVHAVRAVTAFLSSIPDWKIYCVGRATKKRAVSFFGGAAIRQTADDAEGLAHIIIQDKIKQAVFFCGNQRRDILPVRLKEQGISLQELMVYQTHCTPVRLEKDFDAVLFFSPTAVTSFFSLNTVSSHTAVFVLGGTTAAAFRHFAENEPIEAPMPDKAVLFQMAIDYGRSHPIT